MNKWWPWLYLPPSNANECVIVNSISLSYEHKKISFIFLKMSLIPYQRSGQWWVNSVKKIMKIDDPFILRSNEIVNPAPILNLFSWIIQYVNFGWTQNIDKSSNTTHYNVFVIQVQELNISMLSPFSGISLSISNWRPTSFKWFNFTEASQKIKIFVKLRTMITS